MRALLIAIACAACGGKPAPGSVTDHGLDAFEAVCRGWGARATSPHHDERIEGKCDHDGQGILLVYRARDRVLLELELERVPTDDVATLQATLLDPVLDADQRDAFATIRAFYETGATPGNATTASDPPDGYFAVRHTADDASLTWRRGAWTISARHGDRGGTAIVIDHRAP